MSQRVRCPRGTGWVRFKKNFP